jgi:hypothetical protein
MVRPRRGPRRLALLPGLLLGACSSLPRAIVDPREQFELAGAAIIAPGSGDWQLLHQDHEIVSFGRRVDESGHLLTAMVVLTPFQFEDFAAMHEQLRKEPPAEDRRFKRPSATYARVTNVDQPYVEVRLLVEDHAAPGAEGRRMLTSSITRWYLRPDHSAMTVSFSEHRPYGATPVDSSAVARRFFDGFRLAPAAPQ